MKSLEAKMKEREMLKYVYTSFRSMGSFRGELNDYPKRKIFREGEIKKEPHGTTKKTTVKKLT